MQIEQNDNKKGFSLPELMVLLLALSIMLAASAPIVSKRQPGVGVETLPPGGIVLWCKSGKAPEAFVDCDGSPAGTADGVAVNSPDLRGRIPVGAGNASGSAKAWDFVYSTAGTVGGSPTHTLITNELPSHGHAAGGTTNPSAGHTHTITVNGAGSHTPPDISTDAGSGSHSHYISSPEPAVGGGGYMVASTFLPLPIYSNQTLYPRYFYVDYPVSTGANTHGHDPSVSPTISAHSHAVAAGSQSAAHSHTLTLGNAPVDSSPGVPAVTAPFNIMPPYYPCRYIMKKFNN